MSKPTPIPLALATALHAVAVLCLPRPPSFSLAEDESGPRAGAFLRADLYFALDGAEGFGSLDVRRGTVEAQAITDTWRSMSPDALTVGAEALATFGEALPAAAPWAAVPTPPSASRGVTVVPAEALRALAYDRQELRLYSATTRDPKTNTNAPALVVVAPGWRAIVRGQPRAATQRLGAIPLDPARPAALVCSGCGAHGGAHETAHAALEAATRRRWRLRSTDEGQVFACAPCARAALAAAEVG